MKVLQISAILCCCLWSIQLYSFSYGGHLRDFQNVMGGVSGKNLNNVYKTISSGMDSKTYKLNPADRRYGLSFVRMFEKHLGSLPSGNHRLIGHWGFEGAIPFNQEPYKTALAQYPKDKVVALWQSFVNDTVQKTKDYTKLPTTQAKGLAGLIYNIHLLGDYSTTYTDPLPPPKYIVNDIQKNLNRLFGNNNNLSTKVKTEINAIPQNLPDREYVRRVKEVLNNNGVGEKFYKKYSSILNKRGIRFDDKNIKNSSVVRNSSVKTKHLHSNVNQAKGLNFAKNSGTILSATVVAGFVIAQDAMRNGITSDTVVKATVVAAEAVVTDLAMNFVVTQTSRYMAARMLEKAGKKVTERAVTKLAEKIAPALGKSIGGGVQVVFGLYIIGNTIYNYNLGKITQTDMFVNVGIVALTTAGSVFFTCTTGGTKIGAAIGSLFGPAGTAAGGTIGAGIGIFIGVAGGVATGGYTWYVENKRQENLLFEARQLAEWETKDNLARLQKTISKLNAEAEQMSNEAWKRLLPE